MGLFDEFALIGDAAGKAAKASNQVAWTRHPGESDADFDRRKQGLPPAQGDQLAQLAELLRQMQQGQADQLRQVQPGMLNPVKGTKAIVHRDISGKAVDPNAPTGLEWIEQNGPNRGEAIRRQEDMDVRQQKIRDAQQRGGWNAVQALKQAQYDAGVRGPADDAQAKQNVYQRNPNRVENFDGTRVAFQNGIPVGSNIDTERQPGGIPAGGFTDAERSNAQAAWSNVASTPKLAGQPLTPEENMYAFGFTEGPPPPPPPRKPAPEPSWLERLWSPTSELVGPPAPARGVIPAAGDMIKQLQNWYQTQFKPGAEVFWWGAK